MLFLEYKIFALPTDTETKQISNSFHIQKFLAHVKEVV